METRIITAAEVTVWLSTAQPGDSLVFCTGPRMLPGPTQDRLGELIAAGKVRTHQRRVPSTGSGQAATTLEHFMVVKPASAAAPPIAVTVTARPDEAIETIFEALVRCVARGRRAYADRELARIAGLATRNQAAWRVKKLAEAGRIRVETVEGPDRTQWRVVWIGGRSTLRPPSTGSGRARETGHAER